MDNCEEPKHSTIACRMAHLQAYKDRKVILMAMKGISDHYNRQIKWDLGEKLSYCVKRGIRHSLMMMMTSEKVTTWHSSRDQCSYQPWSNKFPNSIQHNILVDEAKPLAMWKPMKVTKTKHADTSITPKKKPKKITGAKVQKVKLKPNQKHYSRYLKSTPQPVAQSVPQLTPQGSNFQQNSTAPAHDLTSSNGPSRGNLESSSTGSSFPAVSAKPIPLAVVSLDSR